MNLSELLKQAQGAYGAYANTMGGPLSKLISGGILPKISNSQVLQNSINKSSPGFKATTTTQSGVPVAQEQYPTINDSEGNPIATKADWYGEYGYRAQQGDTDAQDWLRQNVVDDTVTDSNGTDSSTIDFSTPTSNVAYSMENLNEVYGTKSPEDLWALRQKLRLQESQASAGMLPESEYMNYQGLPGLEGERGYNYDQQMAINRSTADIFSTQVADLDKFMDDYSKGQKATAGGAGYGTNPVIATLLASGKFTKDQAAAIKYAIDSGQNPTAVILNNAKNIMTGTLATKTGQLESAYTQIQGIDTLLKDFYANGGDSSFFKGNYEKVLNKLGTTKDPKLAGIASQIASILMSFRNATTGTAASVSEDAKINSIFPGIDKGQTLNSALTKARLESVKREIDGNYRSALGSDYDNLLKEQSASSNTSDETFEYNGQMYKLNSDGTADLVSFNKVGSGTKQATNRPQRNNNPLNIKASKFTQQFPGVSGLDRKPAADGGYFLTFKTPQDGFNAAAKLIREGKSYKGKTVDQAMRVWSNNGYGGEIAPQFRNKRVDQLTPQELNMLINTMAKREGFYA